MIRHLVLLIFLTFAMVTNAMWLCPAVDKFGKFYDVKSLYIKVSIHKSLARCKTNSDAPASCIVERAYCYQVGQTDMPKSYWQCYAFDDDIHKYPSGPYSSQYGAVNGAENLCQRLSKTPSTCYVPPFTCEKI